MPTGQAVINGAFGKLGILELGGTPSASDSGVALNELNNQWNGWGIDEGLIYAEIILSKALTAATTPNTIGTGGSINAQSPPRVYSAYINTASGRNELKVVTAAQYNSHNDLAAAAVCPDEVYVDFNVDPTTGLANAYTWPVQTGTPTLNLLVSAPFVAWALAVNTILPPGYQDAIEWALAFRLIPAFSMMIPPQMAQTIAAEGQKSELRLREMNKATRQLQPGMEQLQPPQPKVA